MITGANSGGNSLRTLFGIMVFHMFFLCFSNIERMEVFDSAHTEASCDHGQNKMEIKPSTSPRGQNTLLLFCHPWFRGRDVFVENCAPGIFDPLRSKTMEIV